MCVMVVLGLLGWILYAQRGSILEHFNGQELRAVTHKSTPSAVSDTTFGTNASKYTLHMSYRPPTVKGEFDTP